MAFLNRVGALLKHNVGKHITSASPASSPSLFQVIRSMSVTSNTKLFVGGLHYNTNNDTLRDYFSRYGDVEQVKIIVDYETGHSRGFGFVTFSSPEAASSAIQGVDGQELDGRKLRVNYATEKPRGGGYGGGWQGGNYTGGGYQGGNYSGGGYQGGNYSSGGYLRGNDTGGGDGNYGGGVGWGTGGGGGGGGEFSSGGGNEFFSRGGNYPSGGNEFSSGSGNFSGSGNEFSSGGGNFSSGNYTSGGGAGYGSGGGSLRGGESGGSYSDSLPNFASLLNESPAGADGGNQEEGGSDGGGFGKGNDEFGQDMDDNSRDEDELANTRS